MIYHVFNGSQRHNYFEFCLRQALISWDDNAVDNLRPVRIESIRKFRFDVSHSGRVLVSLTGITRIGRLQLMLCVPSPRGFED